MKVTIYPETLERIKEYLYPYVQEIGEEKFFEANARRACHVWAELTAQHLNILTSSKNYKCVYGGMEICVNNTNSSDITEGYYWGYDPTAKDAMMNEFHCWVESEKDGHFIDMCSSFFRDNMIEQLSLAPETLAKDYIWNRKELPDVIYVRNFTYKKIWSTFGIKYNPLPMPNYLDLDSRYHELNIPML